MSEQLESIYCLIIVGAPVKHRNFIHPAHPMYVISQPKNALFARLLVTMSEHFGKKLMSGGRPTILGRALLLLIRREFHVLMSLLCMR